MAVGGAVLSLLKFGHGQVLHARCARVPDATGSPVTVDWGWAGSRRPRGVTKTPHRRHRRPRTAYADGIERPGRPPLGRCDGQSTWRSAVLSLLRISFAPMGRPQSPRGGRFFRKALRALARAQKWLLFGVCRESLNMASSGDRGVLTGSTCTSSSRAGLTLLSGPRLSRVGLADSAHL